MGDQNIEKALFIMSIIAEKPNTLRNCELHHYQEWKASAISDEFIEFGFKSILDPRELDEILDRNTKSRWKHSDNLVPAWVAMGVDPLTDENTYQGLQAKPDVSPIGKDGKPQKYLSVSGMESAPLFLRSPKKHYWTEVMGDKTKPIIITEGAKKAGAGLSAGYPTISIPGVSSCRKKGRLHHLLEPFAVLGRTFYLCFDNDILVKRPVQTALIGLAAKLAKNGSNIMVVELPEGEAKGMDDFLFANGSEDFATLVENAATFEEWKDTLDDSELDSDRPKSKIRKHFEMIEEAWGESLRYNSLKKDIEFNGMPLNAEYLKLLVGLQFPVDISKDDAFTIIEFLAKKNSYSPVEEYLNECEAKYPDVDPNFLDGLAKQFFGSDDPLHATYFKNFLVASVARARVPGCWMDCALLLFGDQGIRKSTFWRTLYGDAFFSDDLGDGSDKDERMKMHRFWCLEWSEFETVYKRKDINQLKAFLARSHETFRTPYDRLPKEYKRACLFVGTTNEREVLNDPTGSRRFWIIPCTGKIPVEDALKLRDRIWAAANALFKSGYEYRLKDEDEISRQTQNQEYEVSHPWEEIISDFVRNKDYVSVQECYTELGFDGVHQNPNNLRQLTSILRKLGLTEDRVRVSGRCKRVWREKNADLKINNSGGSAGSDKKIEAEMPIQQELQAVPVEKRPPDQTDMIQTPKCDPLEEKTVIPVSQAQGQGLSPFDPADPAKDEEKKVEENNPLVCPEKDEYFKGFPAKPKELDIDSGYGAINIRATAYKNEPKGVRYHFLIHLPDGSKIGRLKKIPLTKNLNFIGVVLDFPEVSNWLDRQKHLWAEKIGEKFRIKKMNNDIHSEVDYLYYSATLISIPQNGGFFVFDVEGARMPVNLEDIIDV